MAIFSVTNTNDQGIGSLRQAILDTNALTGKDTINFDGVFADSIADTITLAGSSLNITDDLSIEGTGAEKLTVSGNNKSRVFDIGSGITVEINKLTIANGYLPDVTDSNTQLEYGGAGIRNYGTLTVNNSTITNNRAGGSGGGIFNFYNYSTLTVNNSIISNNGAEGEGGGICGVYDYYDNSRVVINNSIISGNSAGYGGGVAYGTVINSIVTGNSAYNGGGIAAGIVINSTITGNSADSGGGIFGGKVINSTITGNSAEYDGGGVIYVGTVINSTISGNSAQNGGGIYDASFIINSTISGNSGGGIISDGSRYAKTVLTNSTVIGNSAYGITRSNFSSSFTVSNSIIADNGRTDVDGSSFTSNGHNLIGNLGNSTGFDIKEQLKVPLTDVLDTTLRNNGGLSQTYALVYGSPAINAGLNADIALDTTDIDGDGNTEEQIPFDGRGGGFARISGSTIDIGAYEAQENVINGTVNDDTINGTAANDIITGYQGRDILTGGGGADAFVYTKISDLGDTISNFEVARDKIVLKQLFESLNLGNLNFASAISGGYLKFESQGSNTVVLIDPDGSSGIGRAVKLVTVTNVSTTALNNAANFVFAPPIITPSTSIFTVTNTNSSGSGSLEQAIFDANASLGKDIIKFEGVFTDDIPDTIPVLSYLTIRDDLSIEAPGANLVTVSGGYIQILDDVTVEITGLTVADSRTYFSYDDAGIGIINSGTLTLNNSIIRDNGGTYGGGILNQTNAILTINNSTISDNYDSYYDLAGGITNRGILTINNSTISGNRSTGSIGGISNTGTLVVNNSTITGNTNYDDGYYENGSASGAGISGDATVNNSIIAGNFYISDDNSANKINADVGGNFTSNGHNLIGNLNGSTGFNSDEQLTVPIEEVLDTTLRDNGGTVPTHALVTGSPAINSGNNADIPADTTDLDGDGDTTEPIPYDQRGKGFARISDGRVDIGAFEGDVNVINGTSNADTLNGTAGNDIITGFKGRDVLTGGNGADSFVYTSITDWGDTITDFQSGTDKILLHQLFQSLYLPTLNYSSAVTGGYLQFETVGDDTIVLIDPDGTAGEYRAIKFLTVNNISATALNKPINFA